MQITASVLFRTGCYIEEKFKGLEETRKNAMEVAKEENSPIEASSKGKQNVDFHSDEFVNC